MSSVKELKKDISYVLSDIIEECYAWKKQNPNSDAKKAESIINETVQLYNKLLDKVNIKNVEDKKIHFKHINNELEDAANELIEKVKNL